MLIISNSKNLTLTPPKNRLELYTQEQNRVQNRWLRWFWSSFGDSKKSYNFDLNEQNPGYTTCFRLDSECNQ